MSTSFDVKLRNSGIYIFKNKINNKVYVGSSYNMYTRVKTHIALAKRKLKNGEKLTYFYNALNKYPIENWNIGVLEIIDISKIKDKNEASNILKSKEQYYLDLYECYKNNLGYNTLQFADCTRGWKHTEEWKHDMSERNKGKSLTEEAKKRISVANKINTKRFAKENGGGYWKNKKRPLETVEKFKKVRANPIIQLNENFEVIKRWSSAKEAQRESKGFFNRSAIGRCCNGERKTHKGFYWMKECDYIKTHSNFREVV